MTTIAEFYAPAHRGGAFGILPNSKYYGPTGHRGYDVNGWPAGTPIPAFRAGFVVLNAWSSGLGWVLVTYDAGEWFGYSHLESQSPLGVGERVGLGSPIGALGNTGTLSDGDHCHLTVSNASNSPWRGTTKDPWPYIAAALGSSVASGSNQIVIENQKESITMAEAYVGTPSKKIIHFQPGVKAEFDSIPEYKEWRSSVNFLIGHKASDLFSPPPLEEVPEVKWPVYKALCKHFGVPEK